MKTLKLFNAVLAKDSGSSVPHVEVEDGYLIEPKAVYAKNDILKYYKKEALNGNQLNKTFHKSWAKIKNSSEFELRLHQILHYLTTYGTNFQSEVYIPNEVLNVPKTKLVFKVVKAYTKGELIQKALGMLQSGVALKEETVDDLISLLAIDLGYKFTGTEGIKNKEAVVKIADTYGVIPQDFLGFFRFVLYRSTGSALVIKNKATIEAIKKSSYNPGVMFTQFGLERLAEHFNRFKPLFLAFKPRCGKVINKISKLSKELHKPMVQNPLNLVTQRRLTDKDMHWLDNATPYALFKALNATYLRLNGQNTFLYKVRNGKSYVKENKVTSANEYNYHVLLGYLRTKYSLTGKKIFIPSDVVYALPTSEKMYVGNIPMGSKFYGDKLAVGIYWKNEWGVRDYDLSGLDVTGKTGWNRNYRSNNGGLLFSGDITDAPDGAVEYLYSKSGLVKNPVIVLNNVYSYSGGGYYDEPIKKDSKFKIIVGRGDNINKQYMMNPDNLFFETTVESVQKQSVIGILLQDGDRQAFAVLNLGAGQARVSGYSEHTDKARVALVQEYTKGIAFNVLAEVLGAEFVDNPEEADVDLSVSNLERDTFIKLFDKQKELMKA